MVEDTIFNDFSFFCVYNTFSEAKEQIYSILFVVYFSFQVVLSVEMAKKFKKMHNVLPVERDQFVTLRYETYTSIPMKNEKHNLMTEQLTEHEMRQGYRVK